MDTRIRRRLVREGHVLAERPHVDTRAFLDWFREEVLGLDSEAYRRAFWRAAYREGHTIGPMPRTFRSWQNERGVRPLERCSDALAVCFFIGAPALACWLACRAFDAARRRLRRTTYYERERDRRLALGRTRRAITRRWTMNPKPTMAALRAAWRAARTSPEAALRLGGMLEDLECYVDNRVVGDAATGWRGRRGGIKRLLEREAPDLFAHYAALMRYKSIARRFRQACGLADPVPADAALPVASGTPRARTRRVAGVDFPRRAQPVDAAPLAVAAAVFAEAGRTVISLEAALALRIDPDCIALARRPADRGVRPRTSFRVVGWLRRRLRHSA